MKPRRIFMGESRRKKQLIAAMQKRAAKALSEGDAETLLEMANTAMDAFAASASRQREITMHQGAQRLAEEKHLTVIGLAEDDAPAHHYMFHALAGYFGEECEFFVCAPICDPAAWNKLTRRGDRMVLSLTVKPRVSRPTVPTDNSDIGAALPE
ncbi:MAG: hypothetical protein JO166_11110 [Deltaproteobacteria bacterium]|nr:hypothetical protein [Deltaproteobacteria bacterium]